jgi:hypothetical protein
VNLFYSNLKIEGLILGGRPFISGESGRGVLETILRLTSSLRYLKFDRDDTTIMPTEVSFRQILSQEDVCLTEPYSDIKLLENVYTPRNKAIRKMIAFPDDSDVRFLPKVFGNIIECYHGPSIAFHCLMQYVGSIGQVKGERGS